MPCPHPVPIITPFPWGFPQLKPAVPSSTLAFVDLVPPELPSTQPSRRVVRIWSLWTRYPEGSLNIRHPCDLTSPKRPFPQSGAQSCHVKFSFLTMKTPPVLRVRCPHGIHVTSNRERFWQQPPDKNSFQEQYGLQKNEFLGIFWGDLMGRSSTFVERTAGC